MFETMYHEEGIGLAATQVNVHKRIITIDIEGTKENQIVLINPKILESFWVKQVLKKVAYHYPVYVVLVPRKVSKVKAQNRQGEEFMLDADGLLAICIQHEIDHLNGIVFADHLSPLKRQRMKEKLLKLKTDRKNVN